MIYGRSDARFLASTPLFVVLFLLLGEPILRRAEGRRRAKGSSISPEESRKGFQEGRTTTAGSLSGRSISGRSATSVCGSTSSRTRVSTAYYSISDHRGHAYSK